MSRALVVLVAAALTLAGCPSQEEIPMQVKTHDEAESLVRGYAEGVAAALRVRAADHETGVKPSPCQGKDGELAEDGRFYMQGNYQLPLAAGRHPLMLEQLRDLWLQNGYQVKEFRMFNDAEGTLAAENPHDGVQISVESTRPPNALALLILTPCYQPG